MTHPVAQVNAGWPVPTWAGTHRARALEWAMPQKTDLRAYIDQLRTEGYTVRDDHGDDPVLIGPDGSAVETWREDYPYEQLMSRNSYEVEKYLLQIELLKFQYWTIDTGAKHVVVFEGRDAAGKGGTIKRFTEHLNPRALRVVALTKPTSTENGQWYLQRYVNHLPTAGGWGVAHRAIRSLGCGRDR